MTEEVIDKEDIPEYGSGEDHSSDTETQAKSLGWKPQDEFKGDQDKWTDAETFLDLHSRNNGALRDANKKQAAEMAELRRALARTEAMSKSVFDLQVKQLKDEHANQLAFLKAQKRNALSEGDHVQASDIDEQLQDLKARGPELPDVQQETPKQKDWRDVPEIVDFVERNPWVEADEDVNEYIGLKGAQLRQKNPDMPMRDLMAQVEAAAKKLFPAKFSAGTQRRSPVESGDRSSNVNNTGAKTYAAMPKEAREACDEFVADKIGKREEYVKMYFEYDDTRRRN